MHDDVVRSVLAGFGGREVETAGDSFLLVFDTTEGAIRCGLALVEPSPRSSSRSESASMVERWP
jgi:class 3 adenylate cyclase